MIKLGLIAQNFEIFEGDGLDKFARTGKISARHILRAGAQGVILGHPEAGDEPETVHKKLKSIIEENIPFTKLIVIVGENLDEFENSKPGEIALLMKEKCEIIFKGIPTDLFKELIIGYDPRWGSKGSGKENIPPPQPELISACISEMREFFTEHYGNKIKVSFIYGGRSTPERTKQILEDENIDGLILGSACNTVKKTLEIANTMKEVCGDREKVLICNFKAYDLPDSYEEYAEELSKLADGFIVLLAPPYTDIQNVRKILEDRDVIA